VPHRLDNKIDLAMMADCLAQDDGKPVDPAWKAMALLLQVQTDTLEKELKRCRSRAKPSRD
jgi:hypothetical protein